MSTLYVTDLDGTLLNNGSFVSPRSAEILSDLTADGAMITVATARTPATVVPLLSATELDVPYVVLTGAALFDPQTLSFCDRRVVPTDKCRLLNDLFAQAGVEPFIYKYTAESHLLVYHCPEMNAQEENFYEQRAHLQMKRFTFDPANRPSTDVALYFAIGSEPDICALADRIDATGMFSISCYPDIFAAGIYMLEVFDVGVSKADAILHLKEMTGADRLVVFGDNLNDMPMFDVADVAVAVANAQPRVKEAADLVIGPNFDDSVARFILHDYYC